MEPNYTEKTETVQVSELQKLALIASLFPFEMIPGMYTTKMEYHIAINTLENFGISVPLFFCRVDDKKWWNWGIALDSMKNQLAFTLIYIA